LQVTARHNARWIQDAHKKGGENPAFFVSSIGIAWHQEPLPLLCQQQRKKLHNTRCTVSMAGARQMTLRAMKELPKAIAGL